jgi:hypothetical protein
MPPKRHHYVPKFYLDRFTGANGTIAVVDRRREIATHCTNTKNAAVIAGFYSFLDDQGKTNANAESRLSALESDTSTVLKSLDSGAWNKASPTSEERDVLSLFMGVQIARTPEYRSWQKAFQEIHLRERYGYLLAYRDGGEHAMVENLTLRLGRAPNSIEMTNALDETGLLDAIAANQDKRFFLEWLFESALKYGMYIAQLPWKVLESKDSSFLTTDRPVALWRAVASGQAQLGPAIATADVVYFALDSRHVLIMDRSAQMDWSFGFATAADVRRVNFRIGHWASRYIFHSPVRKMQRVVNELDLPKAGPTMHVNGQPIPSDESMVADFMNGLLGYGDGSMARVNFGLGYQVRDRKRHRRRKTSHL